MSNIHFPPDPYERIKVESLKGIDKEKKEEEKPSPKRAPTLAILCLFKELISNVLDSLGKSDPQDLLFKKELREIKKLFERLKKENVSKNLDFLNSLAFKWLDFISAYQSLPQKGSSIQQLIDEINSYPPNQKFSLGYYLTSHAGYKWIPVPFMEILKNLHIECLQKQNCNLNKWISLLEDVESQ